jgi:hypothetical protein
MSKSESSYVIQHPELGLFYGTAHGHPLWTKTHKLNLDSVLTFPTIISAYETIMAYELGEEGDFEFHLVNTDRPPHRASIASCIHAGLEGWVESLQAAGTC